MALERRDMPHPTAAQEGMTIKRIVNLVVDDSGQDLVEYAVTSGMVAAGSLVVAVLIMVYMHYYYAGWQAAVQTAWEPCAPGGCP